MTEISETNEILEITEIAENNLNLSGNPNHDITLLLPVFMSRESASMTPGDIPHVNSGIIARTENNSARERNSNTRK